MRQGGFGGRRDFGGGGGGGSRDFNDKVAPVKVGEEVEVTIEAVGAKGDGIAKKEGFVIFVPNAAKGDTVMIRITKVLNNMAFAEVVGKSGSPQPRRTSQENEDYQAPAENSNSAPDEQPVDTENFGED